MGSSITFDACIARVGQAKASEHRCEGVNAEGCVGGCAGVACRISGRDRQSLGALPHLLVVGRVQHIRPISAGTGGDLPRAPLKAERHSSICLTGAGDGHTRRPVFGVDLQWRSDDRGIRRHRVDFNGAVGLITQVTRRIAGYGDDGFLPLAHGANVGGLQRISPLTLGIGGQVFDVARAQRQGHAGIGFGLSTHGGGLL